MSEGPISIIPEDVLADIFMLAVDIGDIGLDEHYQSSGHLRSKMSIVITHVCQRWRFVAIHSPRMWTQLKICAASQGPLISLFATRSHPLGSTFTFESPGTSSLEDTITDWPPLRIMINKEAAIGIRELRFRHAAAVYALLIDEDAETALALDRVFLSGAHIKDDHTLPFPSCLFHSTQLHLVNSMLDSGSRPFRFLHELVIENSDHETLLWMLECTNMPVLRSLRLCSIRASDPKLVNTVKLPSLGRLMIESSHSFTPALIGRSLMVPNLQHLHVDDLGPQFRTDAQGSLLPMNVVRMKGVDAIKKALSRAPTLTSLSLTMSTAGAVIEVLHAVLVYRSLPHLCELCVEIHPRSSIQESPEPYDPSSSQLQAILQPRLLSSPASGTLTGDGISDPIQELTLPLVMVEDNREWYAERVRTLKLV